MSNPGKEVAFLATAEFSPIDNSIAKAAEVVLQRQREGLTVKQNHALFRLRLGKGVPLALAAVLFLSSVGCGNMPEPKNIVEATSTPATHIADKAPNQPLSRYLSVGSVRIGLDQYGMPVKYTIAGKNEVTLDRVQLEQIKQKAIEQGEVQVANTIISPEAPEQPAPITSSVEHPALKDLPRDVLTEQELKTKGVEIIQADNTYLDIRKQAFEKGGPLEQFNATGRKLKIVLINGPVASAKFMKDPKYDLVRNILHGKDQEVEKYRQEKIKVIEQALNQMRQDLRLSQQSKNIKEIKRLEISMLSFKVILDDYQNKSIEELVYETASKSDAAGYYASPRLIGNERAAVVFVAVGKNTLPNIQKAIIGFHSDGEVATFGSTLLQGEGFEPHPSQTHPDPRDFRIDPLASPANPSSYPYGGTTPGQVLLHELEHDYLTTQRLLDSLSSNYSEYDTDMGAMEWIRKGWERWEKSGYKDDTGFYFVFKLPGDRGYILTQHYPLAKIPEGTHT